MLYVVPCDSEAYCKKFYKICTDFSENPPVNIVTLVNATGLGDVDCPVDFHHYLLRAIPFSIVGHLLVSYLIVIN